MPSEAWVAENRYDRQIEVTEESWQLADYDSVLSLLVIVDSDEPEPDDMVRHYELKKRRS